MGILKDVEPIIENAVKTLTKAIDLTNSPLEAPKPKAAPKPPPTEDISIEGLAEAAAAPAESSPAGGIDLSQLQALLGAQAAAPEPAPAPSTDLAGGLDLSALLGGASAATPAAEEAPQEDQNVDTEKEMLAKLLGSM